MTFDGPVAAGHHNIRRAADVQASDMAAVLGEELTGEA